jgi:type IV pilus assembly protein PilC
MQTFAYQARDPLGKLIEGTLDALSREEAAAQLKRGGFVVVAMEEETSGLNILPRRVGQSEIIYLTSQLAVMVDTGINLSTALRGIAEQETNPALKAVLTDLHARVEGGEDFSTALARHPRQFDKTFVALIKAAEQTGKLSEMLETVATYLRNRLETRQKIRAALAYPSIMAVLAVGVTIFLLTYILPKFEPLFSRKGVKLPRPTIIMMGLSDLLIDYWPGWIALAIAALVTYLVGRRTEAGRKVLDWIAIHVPVAGALNRKITISRSLRTLGTMVASGVSMLEAIRLTGEVSGNYYFERVWQRVLGGITQGERIVDSLKGEPLLPPTLVQMIGAGEETGKLDTVLAKVSSYYDREVEISLKATTSMLEPLMICAMGFVVGGIALGLLMPIFQLSRPGA